MGRSKSNTPKRNVLQTQEVLHSATVVNDKSENTLHDGTLTTEQSVEEEKKKEEHTVALTSLIERSDPIDAQCVGENEGKQVNWSEEEERDRAKKKKYDSGESTISAETTIPMKAAAAKPPPPPPLHNEIQIKKCKRKIATKILQIFPLSISKSHDSNNQILSGNHEQDWVLYKSCLRGTQLEDGTKMVSDKKISAQHLSSYWVQSKQGAITVMSTITTQSLGRKRCKGIDEHWKPLGEAVEQKIMDMLLVQDTADDGSGLMVTSITISLRENAFNICSPSSIGWNVPLKERSISSGLGKRKKISSSKAQAMLIQEVMEIIFPDSILSDCLKSSSTLRNSNPNSENDDPRNDIITAAMLYRAIDNSHLNESEKGDQVRIDGELAHNEPETDLTNIPGLVPTLRKYQEAAVKWMLNREKKTKRSFPEDKAWEICWLIVDFNEMSSEQCILPLYESSASKSVENRILYNPFTGWLSKSYELARAFSHGFTDPCALADLYKEKLTCGTGVLAEMMGLGKTVEVRIINFNVANMNEILCPILMNVPFIRF